MDLTLNLNREVRVWHFQAKMEMGIEQKHEELISILLLAQQKDGKITTDLISDHLLFNFPKKASKLLIDYMTKLKLFEEDGKISSTGIEALERKTIAIPELDAYDIYCVNDPLVPQTLLHYKPVKRTDIQKEVSQEKYMDIPDPDNLPGWILSLNGKRITVFKNRNQIIKILSIDNKGFKVAEKRNDYLELEVVLNSSNNNKLKFSRFAKANINPPEDLTFENVWPEILGLNSKYWQYIPEREEFSLKIDFKGLNDVELGSFIKNVFIKKPEIKKYGYFLDTIAENIPISPKSLEDAQQWFDWFLLNNVGDYLFPSDYDSFIYPFWTNFPEFKDELKIPSQSELIKKLNFHQKQMKIDGKHAREFWYLNAPLDLVMEE